MLLGRGGMRVEDGPWSVNFVLVFARKFGYHVLPAFRFASESEFP